MPLDENGLTEKQRRFVDIYTDQTKPETFVNATKAFIAAGYSVNGANDNACATLAKPKVKAYLLSKRQKTAENSTITLERLDRELWAYLDACKTAKDFTNQGKALQLIGQRIGAYTQKIETNSAEDVRRLEIHLIEQARRIASICLDDTTEQKQIEAGSIIDVTPQYQAQTIDPNLLDQQDL